ncbi:MAG: FAD-dependent oxidoreductase [Promethearchaeota archaeon]
MKKVIEPQKEIEVLDDVDVVVVGGGPAGIGAALSSGRNGAKTLLIEKFGHLGGLQTHGINPMFTFIDFELHGGLIQEILTRLEKGGALTNINDMAPQEQHRMRDDFIKTIGAENLPKRLLETETGYWGPWGLSFDPEYYKYMLETMMKEAKVRLLYHSFAVGAIREGNLLKGVIIETNEGRRAILGKIIIDTTGLGHIIWKSGATCMGDEGFPAGIIKGHPGAFLNSFFINGVDIKKFNEFRAANKEEWGEMYGGKEMIEEAKKNGAYLKGQSVILATNMDVYRSGRVFVMNPFFIVPTRKKPWMAKVLTNCEIDLRKQAWAIFNVVKENVPGFENSYIEKTSTMPFNAVGHRIIGEHVLSLKDMREGRAFDDSVAVSNMPPDLYEAVGRFSYEILPHDVPYRCLVSKDIDNLMAAGTTISATAFSGLGVRYCTPSICIGQATGTAAALAIKNNVSPKMVDVKLVQDTLRKHGAVVSVKDVSAEVLEPYKFIQDQKIVFRKESTPQLVSEEELALH